MEEQQRIKRQTFEEQRVRCPVHCCLCVNNAAGVGVSFSPSTVHGTLHAWINALAAILPPGLLLTACLLHSSLNRPRSGGGR